MTGLLPVLDTLRRQLRRTNHPSAQFTKIVSEDWFFAASMSGLMVTLLIRRSRSNAIGSHITPAV
jgi:hypothetical protein